MAAPGHHLAPPVEAGAPLLEAGVAVVALHGRDHDPAHLLEHLVGPVDRPGAGWLLPPADGGSWYPMRFFDSQADLAPWREATLDATERALDGALAAGIPPQRLVLCGFSQGACLVAELLARRPRELGGAAVLTGCLMGPPEDVTRTAGDLAGLPVHVSGSRTDAWIGPEHVAATARALAAAGARVVHAPRDDAEHRIAPADVLAVRALLDGVAAGR